MRSCKVLIRQWERDTWGLSRGHLPRFWNQWPPYAGHRVCIAYRLPVVINTVHMFTMKLLLSACCPYSSRHPWCYRCHLIRQSISYGLFSPCYINLVHDGHRHRHSSPTGRALIAHRPFSCLFLHPHPQAVVILLPIDLFVLRQVCVQDLLLVLLIHCGPMGTSYASDSYVVHDGSKPSRRHSDHGR